MKKILITGKGSYIGTSFIEYMNQFPKDYQVEELDMIDNSWKEHDFSKYDIVFHVAGIAHIKEKKENRSLYYKINRDLVYEVAKKAKKSKIKQFIFMSSMSVYGLQCSNAPISQKTVPNPNTYYGRSKYEGEQLISSLVDSTFKACIVRPPMVYGDNAPGNLEKLFKMVRKVHIFPTIENQRSSITVECLSKIVKGYLDTMATGIYFPQNDEYMCTYEIVKKKMEQDEIKVIYLSFFNPLIKFLIGKMGLVTKCFGDLVYER